jgi:hypothetical protein
LSLRHVTGGVLVAMLGLGLGVPQNSAAAKELRATHTASQQSSPTSHDSTASAAGNTAAPAGAPQGLNLSVSPYIVDVGGDVSVTVSAKHWSGPVSVSLSFLSPHHGFSGAMVWTAQCSCFRLNVFLAKRVHKLELAHATATVKSGKRTYIRHTTFQVRGLLPNGKSFAPGGTPYLANWVSDPQPVQNEFVHFCAWTRALDAFPVSGTPVTFVVHFPQRTQKWFAGLTDGNGVRCSSKNIHHAKVGAVVKVDVYAGKLHGRTSFTTRSG